MQFKRKSGKFRSSLEDIAEFCIEDSDAVFNGGVNLEDLPSEIEHDQSQDMRNVWFKDGALRTRFGQSEVTKLSGDGISDTDGIECVIDDNFGHIFLQCASRLYKYTPSDGTYVKLIELTIPDGEDKAPKGSFFRYGYSVYFLNGIDYICINGNTASHVEGYIPTVYHITLGYDPTEQIRTPYEENNMLSSYVYLLYDSYNSYKRTLVPKLLCPASKLIISVFINGTEYLPGSNMYSISDFSNNYFAINLTSYPPSAVGYIRVKLRRTANTEFGLPELKDKITYTRAIAYGGDSRVFFCGNGTNKYRYSASYDPSYLPYSFEKPVGNGDELICFGRQYDILTLFKKHETHILSYSYDSDGISFEARCVSPVIGCDIYDSVQTIQNRLVFANTYGGVYILLSTARENEKNVQPISRNVDKLLRSKLIGNSVCSVDFDGRYWLCAGGYVFLWDYADSPYSYSGGSVNSERKLSWYIFDGIKANAFFSDSGKLYSVSSESPRVISFEDTADDFGDPIDAYWHSSEMLLGKENKLKAVEKLWYTLPPGTQCAMDAEYFFTERDRCVKVNESKMIASAASDEYLKVVERDPMRHGVKTFSVRLSCKSAESVLALCRLRIRYRTERG